MDLDESESEDQAEDVTPNLSMTKLSTNFYENPDTHNEASFNSQTINYTKFAIDWLKRKKHFKKIFHGNLGIFGWPKYYFLHLETAF